MISADEMVQGLTRVLAETGPFAPAILFFATSIEYLFPPFPGDLLLVLAAWYASHGVISWPATFLWVTAGALTGAWINYRIGAWLAPRVNRRAEEGGHPFAEKLAHFEQSYRRWGGWLLVFNRFMPGIRAFLFVAAGALTGAWINYRIGAWIAPRVSRRAEEGGHAFAERLARFEESYRRWGGWLLVFNRFMPGIRAFLFVAAGAAGIPLRRVLLLGGISACAWNALMLSVGAFAARNVDELVHFFKTWTNVAWGLLAAAAAFLAARALVRRLRGAPR